MPICSKFSTIIVNVIDFQNLFIYIYIFLIERSIVFDKMNVLLHAIFLLYLYSYYNYILYYNFTIFSKLK